MSAPVHVPTAKEAIAVQLHYQGRSMAQIQKNTGLDREQILAAVDRAAAKYHRNPNAVPPPRPKRAIGKPAPAPVDDRDEQIQKLTALIDGVRGHLAKYEAELADLLADAPAPNASPDLAESREVREWAIAEGWTVPADSRLPGGIVAAFLRARGGAR